MRIANYRYLAFAIDMKREVLAFTIVLMLVVAFPASLFAYQGWLTSPPGVTVISLNANAPASGGWQPDTIRVNLGTRVRLRIASNDVVHGLEVPELGIRLNEIQPGHVEEVEFVASRVGRFEFACTRWCSVDHWRMRGVIEVVDPSKPGALIPTPAPVPEYQRLHIDIDGMHPAQHVPERMPSAVEGAALNVTLPGYAQDMEYLRTNSPSDIWTRMRQQDSFKVLSDMQVWDLLAYASLRVLPPDSLQRGQQLYAQDCAACHGETGKGNGPAGLKLPGLTIMHPELKRGPADFTNASRMLGASDVLLQGKVLRGGMGTGMPEWGSLYSQQEMWEVISFIRSFGFSHSNLNK